MKILLCYATAGEGKIIKNKIKNLNLKINLDITYLCTGMGMYETIFNLTKTLNNQDFDIVLNIGVCGYLNEKKDWIQVARTVNLSTGKELIVPIFIEFGNLESIGCSDIVIRNWGSGIGNLENKLQITNKQIPAYIDMESWAIEYVCDKFRIPRVILKVPVDKIGEELFDREKGSKLLTENLDYEKIIKIIIND
ncbi:hypothetical protein K9M48_04540 [Candidatus Gracilibacteria bacterium]|nr:hypothetical protein [Candidatus Gracilibacteria bacterium]